MSTLRFPNKFWSKKRDFTKTMQQSIPEVLLTSHFSTKFPKMPSEIFLIKGYLHYKTIFYHKVALDV